MINSYQADQVNILLTRRQIEALLEALEWVLDDDAFTPEYKLRNLKHLQVYLQLRLKGYLC